MQSHLKKAVPLILLSFLWVSCSQTEQVYVRDTTPATPDRPTTLQVQVVEEIIRNNETNNIRLSSAFVRIYEGIEDLRQVGSSMTADLLGRIQVPVDLFEDGGFYTFEVTTQYAAGTQALDYANLVEYFQVGAMTIGINQDVRAGDGLQRALDISIFPANDPRSVRVID